jgi:hypothetical protein
VLHNIVTVGGQQKYKDLEQQWMLCVKEIFECVILSKRAVGWSALD